MASDPTSRLDNPTWAECGRIGLYVPDWLHEAGAELGSDVLRRFLLDHGGRELSLPSRELPPDADSVLDWMKRRFGWGKVLVPKGPLAHRSRIAWSIYRRLRDGRSLREIAEAVDLHVRTVSIHKQKLTRRGLLPAGGDTPTKETS